jgi:hypothetical protein
LELAPVDHPQLTPSARNGRLRRYGIDGRVLRRWKQELAMMTAATFVADQITDAETAL